jgi:exonuclease SbcC
MQLAAEHQRLSEQVKPFALINDAYAMAKAEVEQTVEQEIQIAIQHSALVEKQRQLQEIIAVLQEELKKKEDARKQLGQIKGMHDWLDSHFIPLMAVIERHVMAAVQQEFNGLFQQWFSMLVEDEIMGARLDEAFTPIITQNGYDTEVENLSGGERTACALAYRLALNKVVNDLISGIKTKNLLILDEPTDGFSAEQLDKMRDVLDQLPLKQIILVSHELKIESFVQSVVRVQKDEHISRILR